MLTDASIASFLDATSFVVDGEMMQMYFLLVDPDRMSHELSFRDWGHQVAAWANRTFPAIPRADPHPRSSLSCPCAQCRAAGPDDWLYIDFYMASYVTPFFHEYARWLECLRHVVQRKVECFGAPFTTRSPTT
jgi:hypothetical protein